MLRCGLAAAARGLQDCAEGRHLRIVHLSGRRKRQVLISGGGGRGGQLSGTLGLSTRGRLRAGAGLARATGSLPSGRGEASWVVPARTAQGTAGRGSQREGGCTSTREGCACSRRQARAQDPGRRGKGLGCCAGRRSCGPAGAAEARGAPREDAALRPRAGGSRPDTAEEAALPGVQLANAVLIPLENAPNLALP